VTEKTEKGRKGGGGERDRQTDRDREIERKRGFLEVVST
jgi:hypothetical protein